MGSGKSTVAHILVHKYNFTLLQISGKMKSIAEELQLIPSRDFLQGIGKFMRQFDDDVWVRYLRTRIAATTVSVVVDDIRRLNEQVFLSAQGFKFIRLESSNQFRRMRIQTRADETISNKDWERWSQHLTEIQVPEIPVDHIIVNNGSLNELEEKIAQLLKEWEWK